jgi:thiamine phosphate synthase YjbQ (UPF0047 family)
MKSYRKELWFNLPSRRGFVNITSQVGDCLKESGIKEGLVLVNAMHITASTICQLKNDSRINYSRAS